MKLALVSNYELLGPRQVRRWNRLAEELARRGTELFLLTTNVHDGLEVPHMEIPYALREYAHLRLPPSEVASLDARVAVEEHWVRDHDRVDAARGARKCRSFYEGLLDVLDPDVVCIWNTLFPHSRLFQLLCEERDVPVFTIERGLLPGTLMLDRLRNGSASELRNSFALASVAAAYEPRLSLLESYRAYYLREQPAKYPGAEGRAAQRQGLDDARPLLLVLGQALGAGILPRQNRLARQNFPVFDGYAQVLGQLQSAAPDMQIGFRDHPINLLENAAPPLAEGILRLDAGPLHEVLRDARLVVALGATTAVYEALLLKKPVVVVGDTPIAHFGAYVACHDGALAPAIQQAREGGWAALGDAADRALSFLLEHAAIAEDDAVPSARGLADLAAFLAGYDLRCPTPFEQRLEALRAYVETLERPAH